MMSPPNKEARNNNKQLNGDDECGNPNLNEMPITATTQIHSDQDDEDQSNHDNDNDNTNTNTTNYDQHGQVVYQQLQSDDYQQNQSDNDTNDEDFDDFQYLAESRANNKRVSANTQIKAAAIDDDNDIFKQKKLESENIQIDSSKSEIITNIMKNIKISNDCIPDWAKVIPEQLWRKNLIENITVKQTNLFETQTNEQQDHETPSNTV